MAIWYKQGVYGDLIPVAAEGLRKIERLYDQHREDVFVTSIRDGSHIPGSFHPHGRAFDLRKGAISKDKLKKLLGADFDVTNGFSHWHIEYDPKDGTVKS